MEVVKEEEADSRRFEHMFNEVKSLQIPLCVGRIVIEFLEVKEMVRFDLAVGGHLRSMNSECEDMEARKRQPSDYRIDFLCMLENLRSEAFDNYIYTSLKPISWALKRKIDIRNFEVIREKDDEQGTLLHWSCRVDHVEIVRLLCTKSRVDVNKQKASSGQTAAFVAADYGNLECLKVVNEEGGSDINIANNVGVMPLHRAAINNHVHVIDYLVLSGAKIDATDYRGNTSLHRAAYSRNLEACEALLKCGASTLIRDAAGHNPLDVARHRDNKAQRVVRLLEPYHQRQEAMRKVGSANNLSDLKSQ